MIFSKMFRRKVSERIAVIHRMSCRFFSEPVQSQKIVYTYTDEAPALATYAFLPIVRRFTRTAGIEVETSDISVASRILALFPDRLKPEQRVQDNLAELGKLCLTDHANIIKLPNVSASVPQLMAAISELQGKGYDIPDYALEPKTDDEREIKDKYSHVLGSAVNPVLREGNSDRRVAQPVKHYAQNNPHKLQRWNTDSKSHVSYMPYGDFFASEKSYVMPEAGYVTISLDDGSSKKVLKKVEVEDGEVIDGSIMHSKILCWWYERMIRDAKEKDILLSLHLKTTMMKISDPIIFGHCVQVYYWDVFHKHEKIFAKLGINARNGIGDVYGKIAGLPIEKQNEIIDDIKTCYESRPRLAYVNSDKGITNLHVPSDMIIDASMPVVIRDGGKMWNLNNELEDVKCLIPDRSYAKFYEAVLEDCRMNGQFDVAAMGHVANVGLMAKKAEEYGSHDKTFEVEYDGFIRVEDHHENLLMEFNADKGDIWRMCQVKNHPINDWIRLGIERARITGDPAIFWLDRMREHDKNIISKVERYISNHDVSGLEIEILDPVAAVKKSMDRARSGKNTISCTGNVLRDYLTDLFPILELGTSAKMLSIVPLLTGGGLFETGAGGSAPKHVQQFVEENHLRWDSLGEYLAMATSLEHLGSKGNDKAKVLGETLLEAIGMVLNTNKSPHRIVLEQDNRSETFYVTLYWAQAMASRDSHYSELAERLTANEKVIAEEFIGIQGNPVDLGGYYLVDPVKAEAAMRPSKVLNDIIDA